MDHRQHQFLSAVLGDVGAGALVKAVERCAALEHALVPRTLLAWLQSASTYEGEVPGLADTAMSFSKSDAGFAGFVGVGEEMYKFERASLFHLAASVAVSMGVEYDEGPAELRDFYVETLGKSIDLLARARRAADELRKAAPEDDDRKCKICAQPKDLGDHRHLEKGADGGPGPAAAPLAPKAPIPPTPSAPQPGKSPGLKPPRSPVAPKQKTVKLTRSETTHACPSCGQAQFVGDRFVSCLCFRDLLKSVEVIAATPTDVSIRLDMLAWDAEGVLTFFESVGRK